MGLIEFLVTTLVAVVIGYLFILAMGYFAPGHPAIIDKIVWGLVIVIIVVMLLRATGLLHYDPRIPHV